MSSSQTQNKDTKTNPTSLHTAQIQAESHRLTSDHIKNKCARIQLLTYLKKISFYINNHSAGLRGIFHNISRLAQQYSLHLYVKTQTSKEFVHSVKAPVLFFMLLTWQDTRAPFLLSSLSPYLM